MMHERFRWIKYARTDSEFAITIDPDLEKTLKTYFSRKSNYIEEKEQRKLLKSIFEKYNSYFKGKTTQQLQFSNGINH